MEIVTESLIFSKFRAAWHVAGQSQNGIVTGGWFCQRAPSNLAVAVVSEKRANNKREFPLKELH
jgi:hypothetical protein